MNPTQGLPTIYRGMMVEVSPDETFATVHFGMICAVNNGRPHITSFPFYEDGAEVGRPFQNCLHQNDPDLESSKDVIRQDEFRGVYRLAQGELQAIAVRDFVMGFRDDRDSIRKDLKVKDGIIGDLLSRITALEQAAEKAGLLRLASKQAVKQTRK